MVRLSPRFAPLFPLLLVLFAAAPARAEKYPDKWLPVTEAERLATDSAIDPGVAAEAIWVKAWVTDAFSNTWTSHRDYYVRMKIFTEAGAQQYSKVDIDYPLKDVSVDNIQARVVQPDGSIVELDKKAVITETRARHAGNGVLRKSFPLRGVHPGSVIEYRYRRSAMDDEAWWQAYDFQFDFPARLVAYYVDPIRADGISTRQMTFHSSATTERDRDDIRYFNVVATNQHAYAEEPDSPPEYQVRGWMLTYYTTEALREPDVFWKDYGKEQWEWVDKYTAPDREVTELAKLVCSGVTGDLPRVQAMSEWIRANVRLLQSSAPESLKAAGVRRNDNARDVLRQRTGTGLEVDLALVALARGAGMEARLFKVPSRERIFFDEKMMSGGFLGSFDAGIRVDGRWRVFDVASRQLPWDMLPWAEEGQRALLCDRDSSRFVETDMPEPDRSETLVSGTLVLDEDGNLEGDLVTTYTGHANSETRGLFEDVRGSQVDSVFVDALGWNGHGIDVSHVQLDRGAHAWDPLAVHCHVRIKEHATATAKRVILEPSAMRAHVPARFTAGTRRTPVYFEHGWMERDSLRIRYPAAWKVEAVDSPTPVHSEGVSDYRSSTLVGEENHELLYLRTFALGYGGSIYFRISAYPAVKDLFDLVHQKDQSTVTFLRDGKP
jgi:hypothetical protein